MNLTDRTIAAALGLAFATVAPQPSPGPRYQWALSQDAEEPAPTSSATPEEYAAALDRAMVAYEEAVRLRLASDAGAPPDAGPVQ